MRFFCWDKPHFPFPFQGQHTNLSIGPVEVNLPKMLKNNSEHQFYISIAHKVLQFKHFLIFGKMRNAIYFGLLLSFFCCSSFGQAKAPKLKDNKTFELTEISTDPTYGLSQKNPVQVGGVDKSEGPINERRFLNALAGPNGEEVSYRRAGSCCPTESKNDPFGFGSVMLDNYRVTWKGSKDTVSIYMNMYDYGSLKAPVGFTIKK